MALSNGPSLLIGLPLGTLHSKLSKGFPEWLRIGSIPGYKRTCPALPRSSL